MPSAIPKQGSEIHDIATEHGWAINVTQEQVPSTMTYSDGSSREVQVDTYQLVGSKGDAMFMIGWGVNPYTDRWNVSLKYAMLITATELEMRMADAMDQLPPYVYWDHMNYKQFKDWLASDDPEGTLRAWHYQEEENA